MLMFLIVSQILMVFIIPATGVLIYDAIEGRKNRRPPQYVRERLEAREPVQLRPEPKIEKKAA